MKIFSSEEPDFCRNETSFLKLLYKKLPVRTPELFCSGIHDTYPFIIMEEFTDQPLKVSWKNLTRRNREYVMEQTAEILKTLHALPPDKVEFTETHWDAFIQEQLKNLRRNHRDFGLSARRIAQVEKFITDSEPVELGQQRAICHTEIMKEHLFTRKAKGRHVISGLIDFEPSMIAVPVYDLCAVGLFLSSGEKGLFSRFLKFYGYTGSPESIMRMLLLHRYSNLKWFISTIPAEIPTATMEDLCRYWFES